MTSVRATLPVGGSGDPMGSRIEVNGVAYDSIEAMPAEVRRVYEETLARARELSARAGESVPAIVQHGGVTLRTTVRKRFVVNGREYDDETAMPADVRRLYDEAMRAANTGDGTVKRNDLRISFQIHGPGFHFGNTMGTPSPLSPHADPAGRVSPHTGEPLPGPASSPTGGMTTPQPIEPSSAGGLRVLLFLGAGIAAGIVVWLLAH
jgi:hypothetical protein